MDEDPGEPPRQSTRALPEAGWYADPFGRHERRWWDGTRWSNRITDRDTPGIDPPGIDPSPQAPDLDQPADPITDAMLPIPRRKLGVSIGIGLAVVVIVALIVVIGIELTA